MGINLTPRKSNKFESRSVHSSKEELEWNMGGGGGGNPNLPDPCFVIRPYNKASQTTPAPTMINISLVFLLLIIVQGVVIGPPINPSANLKTLVSRSPDGGGGGKPTPGNPGPRDDSDSGGKSAGDPLCPDCG
ncbi:hypothetical protein PSTG_04236 [Puccinia striiformis f. sp. tritici PST-78]|uniref:Uncharacterized protein n=1 Tax=Puccinia striiformis f. sp. tritici PST-78 TaxID=1165861 RepID=A0A0L0VTN0_9BASI|nr:hypothetical protein PSTG_04236 [Puccinia striiformis f. sp. tritici PST-78]